MDKNNQSKKTKNKNDNYIVREKVLVHDKEGGKYEDMYKGPYSITTVWENRTDAIR